MVEVSTKSIVHFANDIEVNKVAWEALDTLRILNPLTVRIIVISTYCLKVSLALLVLLVLLIVLILLVILILMILMILLVLLIILIILIPLILLTSI